MNNQVVNILTRTSKRPNYFKNCVESIKKQTYKNINHIISIDNKESERYVKEYTDNYIFVNKFTDYIQEQDPVYGIRRPAPYNLYLNNLKNEVKDGWIMILDDDNMFIEDTAIEEIMNSIEDVNEIIYWKVKFTNNYYVPEDILFNKKDTPMLNHFDMNGFMFHSKYKHCYFFDYYSAGDFFCAKTLENFIPKKTLINKILTGHQINDYYGGKGKQKDL